MLKSIPWRLHFAWSLLCAILYCIPVILLLTNPKFSLIWLLYVGNGAFLIALVTHIFRFNRSVTGGATAGSPARPWPARPRPLSARRPTVSSS